MNILQQHKYKQKILHKLIRSCQHLLLTSESARFTRQYLNSRLSKQDQIIWQFGYFPDDNNLHNLLSVIPKSDLETVNLYYPKFVAGGCAPHGHFAEHNLIMPFHNVHGEIVALLGRSLLPDNKLKDTLTQKYKYNTGCQKDLFVFGLDKARNSIISNNCVVGVEGQFDCISLHANGITNAVAFGWANLSRYQMFQVLRYTNNIVLMFDNDEAGQKAKKRVKDRYKDIANVKVISPPEGFKDIEEFFRSSKDKKHIKHVIDILRKVSPNT